MSRASKVGLWLGSGLLTVFAGVATGQAILPGGVVRLGGRALYDKTPVGEAGLEPEAAYLVPVRDAVVEVLDASSGERVGVTQTGVDGTFATAVPSGRLYVVRVLSMLSRDSVTVLDDSNDRQVWSEWALATPDVPVLLYASRTGGGAGAFNILDTIRHANDFVRGLDPTVEFPPLTVVWAGRDAGGTTGSESGTSFDPARGTIVIRGDRDRDADEFDDDVILHEYAHFLEVHFSAGDSPGGPHLPGDVLDPRVAWSEGWANFFSGAVRKDARYRDSRGRSGTEVFEYDLESNFPGPEQPGYWSERSVHALLWDLLDAGEDAGDDIQIEMEDMWRAFTSLPNPRFVYLASFLDRLVELGSVDKAAIDQLSRVHFLSYRAGTDAPDGFPRVLEGDRATGAVDSVSRRRINLASSAHFYTFRTEGGAVLIDLDITGTGAGGSPTANDLSLYLMDERGDVLSDSDRGSHGEAERISTFLPRGRYIVEIRSFVPGSGREPPEFNSGAYLLRITRP